MIQKNSTLTNTLRFKHKKPLVNLPSVGKQYGKEIRSCLIATPGYLLCGADMTSLEDTTKRHYMMPYDPQYVKEMSVKGFDPHLDLAKHAKFVTQKQIDQHNRGEINLKEIRKNFKVVNYSATYGVGAEKLSRETGMSIPKAKRLLEAYWDRNWSVKKFSEEQPKPVQQVAASSRGASGRKASRKVKLTPSQVAIAKRLNVPLEEYAKHIEKGV